MTAARPHGQPTLSEREKAAASAVARQVVALLQPALQEIDRKLDTLIEKTDALNALLTVRDAGSTGTLPARLEAAGHGAVPRDGAPVREGARQPCQEQ